jgi:hypothetical protein
MLTKTKIAKVNILQIKENCSNGYIFIVENANYCSSFSSRYAAQLLSLAVAITTQQEGYIYHINCKLLASGIDKDLVSVPTVYSFTAPISCLALERYYQQIATSIG